MKLITETVEEIQYISEAKENGEKTHYIKGIFLQGNIKNRNGRMYPIEILNNEVARYTKELIEDNRAYGELNHPTNPTINLDRVSHIITELKRDGSNYIGKAKIIDTPMGNIAKGIMKSGGKLGVSSRGMGTLKPSKEGIMEVQNDFRLATAADIVADPSAPKAFVEGIMEDVEWIYDAVKDTWKEDTVKEIKREIHKLSRNQLEEQKLQLFEKYINVLLIK